MQPERCLLCARYLEDKWHGKRKEAPCLSLVLSVWHDLGCSDSRIMGTSSLDGISYCKRV